MVIQMPYLTSPQGIFYPYRTLEIYIKQLHDQSFFYITDYAKRGKDVFYFRRDVWNKITQPRIESLLQSNYYSLILDEVKTALFRISNYRH